MAEKSDAIILYLHIPQPILFFIIINVGVRVSLRAPQLTSRALKLTII
jgi:hypothetical protein